MSKYAKLLLCGILIFLMSPDFSQAESYSERFAKGSTSFGVQGGFGYTIDLPPGRDRADISFLFLFPNFQYNLTGMIGSDSWYEGALYWHNELGVALDLNHDNEYLAGFSPLMLEYKFLDSKRGWAPNVLLGAGFAYTNWKDIASHELGSEFEFLLHAGTGLEFFLDRGSVSLNYRFFHVSNAGIKRPNIGLNAHVLSLGFRF
jgi:hypothetical protein